MADLRALANQVGSCFLDYSKRHFSASMFVKLVLVIGGATIAAVAQCIELAHANHEYSVWTTAGIGSAVIVAIGGIFVAITETDISRTIEVARQAVDEAQLRERRMEKFNADRSRLRREVDRGLELYNSMDVMRGAIEQSLDLPGITAEAIIQTCLSAARNSLLIAFDFDIEDTWTICVFMAHSQKESDKAILKCIAHERKIDCDMNSARTWPEGVGVAGVAFSMKNEITIPDLNAAELGTVFKLSDEARSYDSVRYRSMVAVPIRVGVEDIPWGVAVVTSDKPNHFSIDPSDGVPTSEPIRAIGAMAALAIKSLGIREPSAQGDAPIEQDATPAAANGASG
ncbi:energy-converting hydrogenase Eha subunit A [Bradyrhizobium elkanii]|nr:energy-converting hydrogenase Eha subunit A [Bradyrhizobium elkanii]